MSGFVKIKKGKELVAGNVVVGRVSFVSLYEERGGGGLLCLKKNQRPMRRKSQESM